jgi:hypothetical protein
MKIAQIMNFSFLSQLLIMIFDHFSGKENMRISSVCKNWFNIINNSGHLMRRVLFQYVHYV